MLQVDKFLWRGQRPKDLNDLRNAGIQRIISLQSGIFELLHNDLVERQFPCEFGMEQYDLKSSDIKPPEPWAVRKFLELMMFNSKPTYIHCLHGVDRTGFMCAVYRMRFQGWSYERALDEWKALGRHPWYWWWERTLKKWEP